jgi:hypothetical protein
MGTGHERDQRCDLIGMSESSFTSGANLTIDGGVNA